MADALRGIATPHPTVVDEINRAGRAGISLGDLKEALQKAWMPQNTVKGMRLHRYVAHFPAHFDVAGAAAVGKAFNKARVYPRAPVQPSPPPARSAVVPSAAAIAANAAASPPPARSTVVPSAAAMAAMAAAAAPAPAPPPPTVAAKDKAAFSLLTADEKFAAKKLGYNASAWDAGHAPVATTRRWATLPSKQREAARFLGYVKAEWDAEVVALEEAEAEAAAAAVAAKAAAAAEAAAEADAETGPTTATRHSPAVDVRPPTTRHNRGARDRAASDELLRLGGDDGAAYRRQLRETIELRGEVTLGKLAAARARQLAQLAVGGVSGAAAADGVERAAAATQPASLRVLSDFIADSCPELRLIAGEGGTNYEATTLVDLAQSTAPPPPPPAEAAADSASGGGGGSPDASLAERRRKEEGYRREKEIFPEGADEWQREEHEEAVAHLRAHERQRLEKERESRAEREQRKAAERADRDARKADERSFNLRPGITGPVSMRPGDWICPNPACEVVVYGTRSICFKCKTPKPGGAREKIVSKKEAAKIEAKEVMASVAARLGGESGPGGYAAARPKAVAKQEAAAKQEAEAAAKFAEQQTSWYLPDGSLDHVRLLTSPSQQTPDYATLAAQVKAALQGNTRELPHGTVLALVRRAGPEGLTISDLKTKLDGAWPDQPTTKALKLITYVRHFTAFWSVRESASGPTHAVVIDAEEARRSRSGAPSRRDVAMPAAAPPTATPAAVAAGLAAPGSLVRPEVAASLAAASAYGQRPPLFATPPAPPPPPPGPPPPATTAAALLERATADVAAAMRVANHPHAAAPWRRAGTVTTTGTTPSVDEARVSQLLQFRDAFVARGQLVQGEAIARELAAMGVRLNDAARAWDTQASPPPPPGAVAAPPAAAAPAAPAAAPAAPAAAAKQGSAGSAAALEGELRQVDGLAELMKGMSTTIKAKAVAWCRGQDAKSVELVVAAGLEEQLLAALGTELKVGGLQHRELTKRLGAFSSDS